MGLWVRSVRWVLMRRGSVALLVCACGRRWASRRRCGQALVVVATRWASRQRCRVVLVVVVTRSGANFVDAAGHL